jgi:hypothetical protein
MELTQGRRKDPQKGWLNAISAGVFGGFSVSAHAPQNDTDVQKRYL